jgi:hypothetical protein
MDLVANETTDPTTTAEQDRHSAGQRRMNVVWEYTQAAIALGVIAAVLVVDAYVAVSGGQRSDISQSALMQLNVLGALVAGFYFGRTNHERPGGVRDVRR